jgi:hypothetical protein
MQGGEALGVSFRTKDFRSTLTTTIVRGARRRLNAMSAQLRHDKIETTQKSYYRMQEGVAGRQLKDAWKEHPISIVREALLIKKIWSIWICIGVGPVGFEPTTIGYLRSHRDSYEPDAPPD